MYSEEEMKKREVRSAKAELTQIEAALVLLTNNNLACELHIAGMKIGLSDNSLAVPALEHAKAEIEKYLRGEENQWE